MNNLFTPENLTALGIGIFLEILLSFDNASLLAVMIKDLNPEEKKKARFYGLAGAFIFRALSLFVISYIIKYDWIKVVGGLYLLWLTYKAFFVPATEKEGKKISWIEKSIGTFWTTVLSVELLDLALSMDSAVAMVSLSKSYTVIMIATIIGMIGLRFASVFFSWLLEQYNFIEKLAFVVVGLLGLKITLLGSAAFLLKHYYQNSILLVNFVKEFGSHEADFYFSMLTIAVFVVPVMVYELNKKFKLV